MEPSFETARQLNADNQAERDREEFEKIRTDLDIVSQIESLSTKEDLMREHLIRQAESFGVETKVDAKGNLWLLSPDPQGEIMLCAHMDKIGKGVPIEIKDNKVTGRLDDALGISLILNAFRKGLRPSALFTVEEESQQEVEDNGTRKIIRRKLPNGIFNAGARSAANAIRKGEINPPKLLLVLDTSSMGSLDGGPLIYTSSMHFRFPNKPIVDIAKMLNQQGLELNYVDGPSNDSIEFTFLQGKKVGVTCIEIHTDNLHSNKETVSIGDISKASEAISRIITNHEMIDRSDQIPAHAKWKKGPFQMGESR